ncbi:MAG: hypothetical protein ACE15C_05240 [Phycisphaerae bacterium]
MATRSALVIGLGLMVAASICDAQSRTPPGPVGPPIRPGPGPVGPPIKPGPGPVSPPIVVNPPNTGNQPPRATPTPKPDIEPFTGTYRFVSLKDGTLSIMPLNNNNTLNIPKLTDDLSKSLSAAKEGDVLDLQGTRSSKGIVLTAASVYTPQLGEEDDYVYVYGDQTQQVIGKDSFTVVNVKKYFRSSTFAVPNVKGADGKPIPQAAMMQVVSGLKAGDLVEILAEPNGKPPLMTAIRPYGQGKRVTFNKVVRMKIDPATGQQSPAAPKEAAQLTGVEVRDGDSTSTFVIDPKARFALALSSRLAAFKEGQTLIIHTLKDDKGTWLVGAKLAPKQDPPKETTVAKPS